MPRGKDVRPKKWRNINILFDDGQYSICIGLYEDLDDYSIGERWNESYPRQGASPTWYIRPEMFYLSTVNELISLYEKKESLTEEENEYYQNCKHALKLLSS